MPTKTTATIAALLALLAAMLIPVAPTARADDEKTVDEPVGMAGVVQEVAEDKKSIRLKAPKGPYGVTWTKKTRFEVHETTTLGALDAGTKVHVLGQRLESQPMNAGGNTPPQIVKVHAIVAGAFEPPPVPEELTEQGVAWVSGDLEREGNEARVGEAVIRTGLVKEVLSVREGIPGPPDKRTTVFIGGYLTIEGKEKRIEAVEVIHFSREYPDYDRTHAFKERKPPKKKKEKADDDFGL